MTIAHAVAMAPQAALPPPPSWFPKAPAGAMPDGEDEDEARCARYEAEQAMYADGEISMGSDYPDGPLAIGGCPW